MVVSLWDWDVLICKSLNVRRGHIHRGGEATGARRLSITQVSSCRPYACLRPPSPRSASEPIRLIETVQGVNDVDCNTGARTPRARRVPKRRAVSGESVAAVAQVERNLRTRA